MKNNPFPITATFIDEITYDIPSSNWSEKQWKKDFDNMRKVGIDTLVIMRGVFYDKCIYPSKHFPSLKEGNEDFAGFVFAEAEKRNMKVFLGLYISNLSWNDGDYKNEVEQNKIYIEEVLARYGKYSSFTGWYIPQEGCSHFFNLKQTTEELASLCKQYTPQKPVLLSPFFRGKPISPDDWYTPQKTEEVWNDLLENCKGKVDIIAFQDGTVSLADYAEYLSAVQRVCKKYDIHLWANVETFERDVRAMYYPIPFDVLRRKIEIAKGYVEKCITFEFSHFLSPQSIYPSAKNLNALYTKYYKAKAKKQK